jgi:hypothetical protein
MDVAAVYLQVMRSVIDGVRADFSTEQLDEAALTALAKVLFTRKTEKTTFSHDVFDSFGKKKYSRRGPCSKKLIVNLLRRVVAVVVCFMRKLISRELAL